MTLYTSLDLHNLTEINQSPKWVETAAGWECTRRYITGGDRANKEYYYSKLFPQIGTKIKTPRNTEIELHTINIDAQNRTHLIITMQYGGDPRKNGIPEFSVDDGTLEMPIEKHKNYKVCWNYVLVSKTGDVPDYTSLTAMSAQKTTKLEPPLAEKYKWQKDDIPLGEKEIKLTVPVKKGIESYIVPAPVIRETTYYRKLEVVIKKGVLESGIIKTPATPLATKIGGEYLINSVSLSFDGKWWILTRSYQYADKWDKDLYENVDV